MTTAKVIDAATLGDELIAGPTVRGRQPPRALAWLRDMVAEGSDGCWLYSGYLYHGYADISVGGWRTSIHVLAHTILVGPVPKGQQVGHTCANRHCANPAHLVTLTVRERLFRGNTIARRNAEATHCPKGHPLSGANLRVRSTKYQRTIRECRECHRAVAREARMRGHKHAQPEAVRLRAKFMNRRRKLAGGRFSNAVVRRLHVVQRGRCFWCDCPVAERFHVDHIIAIARGGTNDPGNLVIACPECNIRKGASLPLDWAPRRWREVQEASCQPTA